MVGLKTTTYTKISPKTAKPEIYLRTKKRKTLTTHAGDWSIGWFVCWLVTRHLSAALFVGNIQACSLVLNWCFRSWRAAVFKAHGHPLRCSRCFQRRTWEQASDWLNSCDGGEETKMRVDQLSFASNSLLNPSSFTLYLRLWDVWDTVLIKNFQVSPKPFVFWTARFKRDLCGWRAKLRDWKMMTEFVLDLANCMTGRAYTVRGSQVMRGTKLYKDWTRHTFTALWSLWNGKVMTCSACTVCGSQLMRGSKPFWRLDTAHFYCPFLVCCA